MINKRKINNSDIIENQEQPIVRFRVYDIENKCYLKQRDCFINGLGQLVYRDSQGMLNNWNKDFRIEFENE